MTPFYFSIKSFVNCHFSSFVCCWSDALSIAVVLPFATIPSVTFLDVHSYLSCPVRIYGIFIITASLDYYFSFLGNLSALSFHPMRFAKMTSYSCFGRIHLGFLFDFLYQRDNCLVFGFKFIFPLKDG